MYFPHRNTKLQELFSHKPCQGADPATAQFIFFGLDANYAPEVGDQPYFSEIVTYLEDGAEYWRQRGIIIPSGIRITGETAHFTMGVLLK